MKLLMLRGLPASGKSTWAKELVCKDGNWKRINKDDLRAQLHDGKWSHGLEQDIIDARNALVVAFLAKGKNVVVDDTNYHPKHENVLRGIAAEHGAEFEIKDFEVDLDTAIERDAKRPNSVGEKTIKRMYYDYVYNKPYLNKRSAQAIICDLDGTLAHLNGRSPYDASTCENDTLNGITASILRPYIADGSADIVYMSGREDKYREPTTAWLKKHGLLPEGKSYLFMRPTGDSRKDAIVKRELFDANVNPHFTIQFVLDDRNQVVEMWRACGLTCLQVADGDF